MNSHCVIKIKYALTPLRSRDEEEDPGGGTADRRESGQCCCPGLFLARKAPGPFSFAESASEKASPL